MRGKKAQVNEDAARETGVLGVANALVSYDPVYEGLVAQLLGRTLVVDTIDHAIVIQRKYRQTLRMVTLEGELLSPGGSMTGGSFRNNSNLLGRRREIDAKKSGLCQKIFENFDERPKSLLYAIAMDAYPLGFSGITGESLEQQVHLAIFKTIRHIAEEGPCVIIGRSADYALADNPNLLSLFISAPLEDRIARVAKRQKVTPEEAKSLIQKTDKRRASYCEYYASKKWGAVDAYDFCLNSSALGLGGTVELIQAMVAHKEHPIPSPTEIDPTQTEA